MAYTNVAGLIAAVVIVQLIVFTFVTLRIVSRKRRGLKSHVSEWIILVSTVLTTGIAVAQVYGLATDLLGVPLGATAKTPIELQATYKRIAEVQYSVIVLSLVTSGLVKISVCFFYLQIFNVRKFRIIIIPWMSFVALWTLTWTVLVLAQCGTHFLAFLNFAEAQKYCLAVRYLALDVLLVIFPAVSDFITVLPPVPMVMSLQMPLMQRFGLVAIFMVGFLSVGASVAKAYMFIAARLGIEKSDYGLLVTFITSWSLIEVQVGIIAACAPTLRPILDEVRNTSSIISSFMNSAKSYVSRSSSTDGSKASKSGSTGSLQDGSRKASIGS